MKTTRSNSPEAMTSPFVLMRTPPQPRKRPRQSRSRMLVASLNEACLRIVRSKRELTVSEIAAVAGVAMGSVYQYFPNIEAIIASAYEDVMLEEINAIRCAAETDWRKLDSDEALVRLVGAAIGFHRRLLDLDREIGRDYYLSFDVDTWLLRVAGGQQAATGIVRTVLQRRYPDMGPVNIEILAQTLTTSLRRAIIHAVRCDPTALESPKLEQDLISMCHAALSTRS